MGVNFLLIQRVPSERRPYALQHREHRVENQASRGWLPNSETIAHPVPRLETVAQVFVGIRAGASGAIYFTE